MAMSWSESDNKVFPGSVRCQVDAPEGCGRGIISVLLLAIVSRCFFPTTSVSLLNASNWCIASLPTGNISFGLSMLISA